MIGSWCGRVSGPAIGGSGCGVGDPSLPNRARGLAACLCRKPQCSLSWLCCFVPLLAVVAVLILAFFSDLSFGVHVWCSRGWLWRQNGVLCVAFQVLFIAFLLSFMSFDDL